MPLPLAMMIPFMGIQSAVMAKQFGENFQYGKRRISAMSNEEFNKLTPALLQANANAELKAMIPTMQQSIQDMQQFQTFLIKEFLKMVNELIKTGVGQIFGLDENTLSNITHFLHGHFEGHGPDDSFIGPPEQPISPPPPQTILPPTPPPPPPAPPKIIPKPKLTEIQITALKKLIKTDQNALIVLNKNKANQTIKLNAWLRILNDVNAKPANRAAAVIQVKHFQTIIGALNVTIAKVFNRLKQNIQNLSDGT